MLKRGKYLLLPQIIALVLKGFNRVKLDVVFVNSDGTSYV